MDRHSRQAKLREVGAEGQARIERATAAVGLDGFAADVAVRYLAGAGIGGLRVRQESLRESARSVDAAVLVEVDRTLTPDDTSAFDLKDPVTRAFASGATWALRSLRRALAGGTGAPGGGT